MDIYQVIKKPLVTEKGSRLTDTENKLLFETDNKATKRMIKKSVENLFKVKVKKVNTLVTKRGKKRAYVVLEEGAAADVLIEMGLM